MALLPRDQLSIWAPNERKRKWWRPSRSSDRIENRGPHLARAILVHIRLSLTWADFGYFPDCFRDKTMPAENLSAECSLLEQRTCGYLLTLSSPTPWEHRGRPSPNSYSQESMTTALALTISLGTNNHNFLLLPILPRYSLDRNNYRPMLVPYHPYYQYHEYYQCYPPYKYYQYYQYYPCHQH